MKERKRINGLVNSVLQETEDCQGRLLPPATEESLSKPQSDGVYLTYLPRHKIYGLLPEKTTR